MRNGAGVNCESENRSEERLRAALRETKND
nr:MAG TPA: hypothetical protein [Caudoviricetes sp.]